MNVAGNSARRPGSARPRVPAAVARLRARRRRRGLVRLAVLVLAIALVVFVGARVAGAASPGHNYTVRAGDTLWSIAGQTYGNGHDLRAVVFHIEHANHLRGPDLQPGEELLLPAVN